jgi:aspartate/methionine/tyrosine aminotransferase
MRRIDAIEPFRVMQLLERARQLEAQGKSVIHMEIGEPDLPTPPAVTEAARTWLATHNLSYTPSTGAPALQQALCRWYEREYGLAIAPERFLITPGTSGAFSLIYAALLDAGESVLLPDPGYPCQRNFIRLAGGEPLAVPVGPATGYHLDRRAVEDGWRADTRAAVVISPGNPTGTLIDPDQLAGIAAACRERGGWLISDEIYHGLTYGRPANCALAFDDAAIVVNGCSKRWAMTGWRIGWIIVPEALIDPCRRVMQNIFISAPTLSQHAAIAALAATDDTEAMRATYDERRRCLLDALPGLGFEVVVEPQGAFYIYANVEALTDDARRFCWDMLEQAGVAITPGEDFGRYGADRHVRLSYATGIDQIREGIRRMTYFLKDRR